MSKQPRTARRARPDTAENARRARARVATDVARAMLQAIRSTVNADLDRAEATLDTLQPYLDGAARPAALDQFARYQRMTYQRVGNEPIGTEAELAEAEHHMFNGGRYSFGMLTVEAAVALAFKQASGSHYDLAKELRVARELGCESFGDAPVCDAIREAIDVALGGAPGGDDDDVSAVPRPELASAQG